MATINYLLRSKSKAANLYVRFVNGRAYNITTVLPICIDPKFWDDKNQKIRNVLEVRNRDEINRQLAHLKLYIPDEFNKAFMSGEVIDVNWLAETCKNFFQRPKQEVKGKIPKHLIYYTDFALWWIENKSSEYLVNSSTYMNEREKGKYLSFIRMVQDFEGRKKLKIKDVTSRQITAFVNHLAEQNYASKTIQRHISRFKFFLFRAEEDNMSVNNAFKQKVYVPKAEPLKEPYFNEEELEKIFNADFKGNKTLENVRDNLIIACWTGLRVSDFLGQLDISNFIDDFIEVTTQKTKTKVVIPVHPHVKRILINRKGKLPEKISDQKFNKYIKQICKKLKFNEFMKGGIYDKDKKRKVIGMHPKWKLITSHIGRRSFATNHYGKIPNSVIMGVCGWAKEEMMLHYIKKSNKEHAVELKQYWDKIYS